MESENYWLAAWNNFGVFSGRATRSEYWLYRLEVIIVGFVIYMFFFLLTGQTGAERLTGSEVLPENEPILGILILGVAAILGILLIIVDLGVTIRRLHDTGRSGWWIFIRLVPYIGGLVLFIFTLLDSESGENQYGPSPKNLRAEINQYLNPS